MKLLVDMNLSLRWIPFLVDAGSEAVHRSTAGNATLRGQAQAMAVWLFK